MYLCNNTAVINANNYVVGRCRDEYRNDFMVARLHKKISLLIIQRNTKSLPLSAPSSEVSIGVLANYYIWHYSIDITEEVFPNSKISKYPNDKSPLSA